MGENCGSWFPNHQFDYQSPKLKSLATPLCTGQQEASVAFMKPNPNMISTNGTLPVNADPRLLRSGNELANGPYGWFYCLPRFRQAFAPLSNSISKEQLPVRPYASNGETFIPNAGPGYTQKRFLVVDQSGEQTTLMFSPGIGTPIQCPSWGQKPTSACNLKSDFLASKIGLNLQPGIMSTDKVYESNGVDVPSEMHEDTEELNALLYSADDSDHTDEDDEVTSTGHSPSTMTVHDQQNWSDESPEEVASSSGPAKKRKLLDEDNDDVAPSLVDTASSAKLNGYGACKDDAQSSCGNGKTVWPSEIGSLSGIQRMKKRKIRETVSILQSILPVGKNDDVVVVLDEAINYLKHLRHKAEALGLDSP